MPPRRVPSHAVVGPIVVDWFRGGPPPAGATAWALTHAHTDHYGGLSPAWPTARTILATAVTAALATHLTGAPRAAFSIVDIGAPPAPVPGAAGWRVAAVDAQHCPGAACFLFLGPDAQRVLHTGDCRATPALVAAVAALAAAHGPVTALHLDTTYAHPRHTFPGAAAAIAAAVDAARGALDTNPGAMVAVQSYVVGKEPLLAALAAACGPVGVSARRAATLRLAAPAVRGGLDVSRFVSSEDGDAYRATRVRVTQWGALADTWPFFKPNFVAADALARAAGADSILCIVPTGWAAAAAAARGGADRARGDARVIAVPYSEHSSFDELRALVAAARPARLVPTVGGTSDRDAGAIVGRFRDLLDGRAAAAALWGGRVKEEAEAAPPQPKEEAGTRPPSPPAAEDGDGGDVAAIVAALDISTADAVALLAAAGGDATRAVNDWLAGRRPSVIAPRGAAGGLAAPPPTCKKRGTPPPFATQPAKKTKAAPSPAPDQKPLAVFFGGGRAAAPAAEKAPPAAADQPKPPPAHTRRSHPPLTPAAHTRPPLTPAADPPAPAGPDPARLTAPLEDFDPATDARWPRARPARAPYAVVAAALAAVDGTRSRLAIARALTNALRCVLAASLGDLADTVHLLLGVAAPEHEGVAPGLGAAAAVAAIAGATGSSAAAVRAAARASGDLGDAAAALSFSQTYLGRKPPPLTVGDVVASLRRCAAARGPGAARDRVRALEALLRRAAGGAEARYLVRTALGCLRVGAGWRSVLPALGAAVAVASSGAVPPPPALAAAAAAAAAAYARCPDVPVLVAAVLADGGGGGVSGDALARLAAAGVAVGVPARPMLATMAPSSAAAVARLGPGTPFLAEFKYDGVRAQVHIPRGGGAASIFSRGGETATPAWPDAAAALAAALPPSALPAILDAEIVAVDRSLAADAPRRLLPFQLLAARPRAGQEAAAADAARPVCAFVFDCLMLHGQDVTARPLADRRAALAAALRVAPGRVELAHAAAVDAGADDDARHNAIEAELAASLAAGAEGVMLKSLASPYVPAARALTWLKLKADYNGSGGVDVDAVVIGGWRGHGRKAGWVSPFLVAVRDARGGLASVARVMSGFTDAFYKDATARLLPGALDAPPPRVCTRETPAFWFAPPFEVWQIKAAELSASRVHTAARGRLPAAADRGLALRFPRFVRVRGDKREADATHADELLAAYGGQARRLGGNGDGGGGGGGGGAPADVFDDGLGGEWPFGGESD